MRNISDIASEFSQASQDKQVKAQELAQSRANTDRLSKAIDNLNLEIPKIQKVEMGMSITGLNELLDGLNTALGNLKKLIGEFPEVADKLDETAIAQAEEIKKLTEAVKDLNLDVIIPKMPDQIKVTDQDKILKLLTKIVNKPDFEKTTLPNLPSFPSKITVSNLTEVTEKLESLNREIEEEPQPIGFSWDTDDTGKLATFTEQYTNGKIVSTGWNLARVKIDDQRN